MKNMPAGQWRCIIGQTDTLLSVSSRTAGAPRCFSLKSGAITTPPQCKRGCLRAMTYRHVECVIALSKGEIDSKKVRVEFSLEGMDTSGLQKGATYPEIKARVLEQTGLKVSSLYISQVKQKCGLEVRENHHKVKSENTKQPQCPKEKEDAIVEALKHFQMI